MVTTEKLYNDICSISFLLQKRRCKERSEGSKINWWESGKRNQSTDEQRRGSLKEEKNIGGERREW